MRHSPTLPAFAAALLLIASPSSAQTGAGGDAQSFGGPVVAGVCFLSREALFANARVGKAASARLKDLASQAQTRVEAERKPLDADVQTFRSQAAPLSADQRQTRDQSLAQRMQTVQSHTVDVTKQIEATCAKALARNAQEAQPLITGIYKEKSCGLLLDRNALRGGNVANDLTAAVV
jgi:Skp family chaperone for outer membrane proteins